MITISTNNLERAETARMALESYMHAKGLSVDADQQPLLENVIDLLADLRHMSAAWDIDFSEASRISQYHYDEEST